MQSALTIVKYILPPGHFPTFLGFINSLGSSKLPSRSIIQSPETGFHDVLQMQNLSAPSEERNSNRTERNKKKKKGKLRRISLVILLTCFFRELREGLHSLLTVAALGGDGRDVGPAQGPNDVHHGLGLEGVGRNHPREEIVALVVAQLRGCRGIADLWNLEEKKTSWGLPEIRRCINSGVGLNRARNRKWWLTLDMQIRQKSIPVIGRGLSFLKLTCESSFHAQVGQNQSRNLFIYFLARKLPTLIFDDYVFFNCNSQIIYMNKQDVKSTFRAMVPGQCSPVFSLWPLTWPVMSNILLLAGNWQWTQWDVCGVTVSGSSQNPVGQQPYLTEYLIFQTISSRVWADVNETNDRCSNTTPQNQIVKSLSGFKTPDDLPGVHLTVLKWPSQISNIWERLF